MASERVVTWDEMVVGQDLKTERFPFKITEEQIRIFKIWGVTEADIQDIEKEEVAARRTAQIDPLLLQEAEAQGRKLFRHTDLEHPFIKELFRLFTLRMVRHKSEGDNHV